MRLLFVGTLSVLPLALACAAFGPSDSFRERVAEQVRVNEARWKSLGFHDYDFTYGKLCDCLSSTLPVRISVRADTVERVLDATGTGEDVTARTGMDWPTVDSLFARARAMLADHSVTIQLIFDPDYGYPTGTQSYRERTGDLVRHTAEFLAPVTVP